MKRKANCDKILLEKKQMDARQTKLEKKIRKAIGDSIKGMSIEDMETILPKFVECLKSIYNRPSHSQFYLDDLEREFNKEVKKLKK